MGTTCLECDETLVTYYILPGWAAPIPLCEEHAPLDDVEEVPVEKCKIYKLRMNL